VEREFSDAAQLTDVEGAFLGPAGKRDELAMSRPGDWTPLAAADPVPGDPVEAASAADGLHDQAGRGTTSPRLCRGARADMIRSSAGDRRPSDWSPDLRVPAHTLWLPLGSDKPLKEIGARAALKILGTETPDDHFEKFARVIRDGTKSSRDRGAMMGGLIFFPDYQRLPPIAAVDVFGYHSDEPGRPSSLESFREHFRTLRSDTAGPVEVTDLELPAGPAIRFHRRFRPKQGRAPVAYQWEEVMFAVRPPQISDCVVMTVSWVESSFSPALTRAADAMAPTLAIMLDAARLA
jgi:hypothetical protein